MTNHLQQTAMCHLPLPLPTLEDTDNHCWAKHKSQNPSQPRCSKETLPRDWSWHGSYSLLDSQVNFIPKRVISVFSQKHSGVYHELLFKPCPLGVCFKTEKWSCKSGIVTFISRVTPQVFSPQSLWQHTTQVHIHLFIWFSPTGFLLSSC